MQLILASTSLSRQKVLRKLGVPFQAIAPDCDETPYANETATELVLRLAESKARSLISRYPNSLIIGSDQVGVLDGQIIGKPHTIEKAKWQLQRSSGKTLTFYTGLSVINSQSGKTLTCYEPYEVTFRPLSEAEIDHYIAQESPLQCAGSFKCDELGITLFARLSGNDINALIGLPLLILNQVLLKMDYNLLLHAQKKAQ